MSGGYACRTGEDTKSASFHADVQGLCAALGTPSEAPPSSGRSEAATRPYTDAYADTLASPTSLGNDHPNWCVDAGSVLLTMTTFELWEGLERGEVLAWMRVWREGMECWTPIGEITEFAWAIAGTPVPPAEPAPLSEPLRLGDTEGEPLDPAAPPGEPAPDSGVRPATAPRAPGRRRGARWIALGSAVAIAAVACALFVRRSSPPAPVGPPGGGTPSPQQEHATILTPALLAEPPVLEAVTHHDERGQRRQSRGGRHASAR